MSIRIIPQDELGSSEKRTADMIPPLLFPRLKNLYNRRAERLRELAENNPLGDYLRFAALIAHAQEVVLYDHPLEMDLTARIKEASAQGKPPLDRKSTRLNSSHVSISYAVFCLKKKKRTEKNNTGVPNSRNVPAKRADTLPASDSIRSR